MPTIVSATLRPTSGTDSVFRFPVTFAVAIGLIVEVLEGLGRQSIRNDTDSMHERSKLSYLRTISNLQTVGYLVMDELCVEILSVFG